MNGTTDKKKQKKQKIQKNTETCAEFLKLLARNHPCSKTIINK